MTPSAYGNLLTRLRRQVDHLSTTLDSALPGQNILAIHNDLANVVDTLLLHSYQRQSDRRVAVKVASARTKAKLAELMAVGPASKIDQGVARACARDLVLAVRAWLNAGGPTPHPDLVETEALSEPPRFSKVKERKPALDAYLEEHGRSQKQLAAQLHMDRGYIWKWRKGKINNSSGMAETLENLLFPRS